MKIFSSDSLASTYSKFNLKDWIDWANIFNFLELEYE